MRANRRERYYGSAGIRQGDGAIKPPESDRRDGGRHRPRDSESDDDGARLLAAVQEPAVPGVHRYHDRGIGSRPPDRDGISDRGRHESVRSAIEAAERYRGSDLPAHSIEGVI